MNIDSKWRDVGCREVSPREKKWKGRRRSGRIGGEGEGWYSGSDLIVECYVDLLRWRYGEGILFRVLQQVLTWWLQLVAHKVACKWLDVLNVHLPFMRSEVVMLSLDIVVRSAELTVGDMLWILECLIWVLRDDKETLLQVRLPQRKSRSASLNSGDVPHFGPAELRQARQGQLCRPSECCWCSRDTIDPIQSPKFSCPNQDCFRVWCVRRRFRARGDSGAEVCGEMGSGTGIRSFWDIHI